MDLDAPSLDLSDIAAPEAMLHQLRVQNLALDRLRCALASEDGSAAASRSLSMAN